MSWIDTSFVRNALSFEVYRRLGGWAPHSQPLNLVFQGQPVGLYAITEKIETAPHRLSFAAPRDRR